MTLVEVTDSDKMYRAISLAFQGDKKLFDKYHILSPCEEINGIYDTFEKIKEAIQRIDCKFFEVRDEKKILGYCVLCDKHKILYSFGINLKERWKYSRQLFELVTEYFSGEFICILWTKNKRGIDFLKRNGMEIIEKTNITTTLCL